MIDIGPGRREPKPTPFYGEGAHHGKSRPEDRPLYEQLSEVQGSMQQGELKSELKGSGASETTIKYILW